MYSLNSRGGGVFVVAAAVGCFVPGVVVDFVDASVNVIVQKI